MNAGARLVAAACAAIVVAWAAGGAIAHDRPAELGAMAATGAVRLTSPTEGTAVLTAANLVPGQSVTGTVQLTNTGDAAGALALERTALWDSVGDAGATRLSSALVLTVEDVTGALPFEVYRGRLDELDALALGPMPAGMTRTYRLTATLPDRGAFAGQNALQGTSMRVDWAWRAGAGTAGPTPTPTATPTPVPTAPPTTTPPIVVEPVPAPTTPAASVLHLQIPWQRVITTRGITVYGTCDRLCRLTFTAEIQTAPRNGGRRRTIMRRRVFRVAGTKRVLLPGAERRIRLRLRPKAIRRMHSVLLVRGRVGVVVRARVRSSLGAATVERRIVIVTANRAARHRAARKAR